MSTDGPWLEFWSSVFLNLTSLLSGFPKVMEDFGFSGIRGFSTADLSGIAGGSMADPSETTGLFGISGGVSDITGNGAECVFSTSKSSVFSI